MLTNRDDFRDLPQEDQFGCWRDYGLEEEEYISLLTHMPSRSGGELDSKPNRIEAARIKQKIIDSISKI